VLIECLTLMDGITIVPFKNHNYEFMPLPGALDGEQTTSVCNIADQEAVDYMIGNPNKIPPIKGRPNFRPYRPKQAQDEMAKRRSERELKEGKFTGYSIDVLNVMGNDKGYVIKHREDDGTVKFCGGNGVWTDDIMKVWPFTKIGDADAWLRAFIEGQPTPVLVVDMNPYHCAECAMSFADPIKLADHWKNVHQVKESEVKSDEVIVGANKLIEKKAYTNVPKG